ncbi:hypothetical protein H1C71_035795, partial [Ictidomys tridecemlineatus]
KILTLQTQLVEKRADFRAMRIHLTKTQSANALQTCHPQGWVRSAVEHLPSMCKALGSMPSAATKRISKPHVILRSRESSQSSCLPLRLGLGGLTGRMPGGSSRVQGIATSVAKVSP